MSTDPRPDDALAPETVDALAKALELALHGVQLPSMWSVTGRAFYAARLAQHPAVRDLIAKAEQRGRAEAWDRGHLLTRPHSDLCEPTCPNPYRQEQP